MNAGFGSVFDRVATPAEISLETYRGLLAANTDSPFELMVHPARVDDELREKTRIAGFSERERQILLAPQFVGMLSDCGWLPANYRDAFP
jgi:predicted glycoside hydrolase/deacetylase ChbG (UPF0249 family)